MSIICFFQVYNENIQHAFIFLTPNTSILLCYFYNFILIDHKHSLIELVSLESFNILNGKSFNHLTYITDFLMFYSKFNNSYLALANLVSRKVFSLLFKVITCIYTHI